VQRIFAPNMLLIATDHQNIHTVTTYTMSTISNIVKQFIADHPEELVDGKLKVCIGGGAGFIGSHIAKQLMGDVRSTHSLPSMALSSVLLTICSSI
jgi:predicted amino acid dehydrogenase